MPSGGSDAATFTVWRNGRVVLRTDDWVTAQRAAQPSRASESYGKVEGTHPTHRWTDERPRRCIDCGGWDNGSYGSQAPCGYDWSQGSLLAALEREEATASA